MIAAELSALGTVFTAGLIPRFLASAEGNLAAAAFVALAVLALVILVMREIACWYFKINLRIAQMNELITEVRHQNLRRSDQEEAIPERASCPKCGKEFTDPGESKFCEDCGVPLVMAAARKVVPKSAGVRRPRLGSR